MASKQFINQMNKLNDEFIEFEIKWLREFIKFIDAHKQRKSK